MEYRISVQASGSIVCPPDWGMSVGGCDFHRLYLKRGGKAFCRLPDREFPLEDDTLYLFPVFAPYQLRHDPDQPLDVLWFHISSLPVLTRDLLAIPLRGEPALRAGCDFVSNLVGYTWQGRDGSPDRLLEPALVLLFDLIGRKHPLRSCRDPRIAATLARLEEANGAWMSMENLARAAGMEPHYFSRVFHREVGLPVKQYQLRLRIRKAMVLLRQDARVGEVAASLGYEDEKSFSRAFRQVAGVPPGEFRKSYLLQP